jgi:hypothetical protein
MFLRNLGIFMAEDGKSMFLRNVGIYLRVYMASKPKIISSSSLL